MINRIKRWISVIKTYRFSTRQIINQILFLISKKKPKLLYQPTWLLIYVSDLCNFQCKMCPHHTKGDASSFQLRKKQLGMMKASLFEEICKRYPESTLVMLAGVGEPLLNPEITQFFNIADQHKKMINLVTNGYFLNKTIRKAILNNKSFNQVSISLNASDPDDYQSITSCPPTVYNTVISNIKELVKEKAKYKSNCKIILSAVASQEFLPQIKEFLIFCDQLNVNQIEIHNYIKFGIKEKEQQWHSIQQNEKTIEAITHIDSFCKKQLKTTVYLPKILNKNNFKKKCPWFFRNLAFDAYGNVSGCGRVMPPLANNGNLNQNNLWNSAYMQKMRKKYLSPTFKLPECCNNCIENYE